MNSRIRKFLLICILAVGAGLILSIIGYMTGGVESMEKLPEKYSWIHVPSGDKACQKLTGEEFDSVQINGDADVQIYSADETAVCTYYDEKAKKPQMYVENGVLKIDLRDDENSGLYLELGEDSYPMIEISCKNEIFDNINVESHSGDIKVENIEASNISLISENGDIDVSGCSIEYMQLQSDYGDVTCKDISNYGLSAKIDTGDLFINGSLKGPVDVQSVRGNVDIVTDGSENMYSVIANVDMGQFCINGQRYPENNVGHHHGRGGWDGTGYHHGDGQCIMRIMCDTGDVDVSFNGNR